MLLLESGLLDYNTGINYEIYETAQGTGYYINNTLSGAFQGLLFMFGMLALALLAIKFLFKIRGFGMFKVIIPIVFLGAVLIFIRDNILMIMAFILGGVALYCLFIFIKNQISKNNQNNNNSLKTAKKKEVEGIVFGKVKKDVVAYSPTQDEGHLSVFGGSGSGKTSALLIPTLRVWKGNAFVIDISGDIIKNVPSENALVYDVEDKKTTPFNIFGAIDKMEDEDDKNEALEKLAFLLMPDNVNANANAKFFTDEGRKILTASLICYYKQGLDFIQIAEKIVRNSWKDLFSDIDKSGNMKAIQYINSFVGANEANTAGCKQSADGAMKLFATNERIKKGIRRPVGFEECFTPATLEEKSAFVKIEDAKLDLYSPILHIITAQTLEFLSARENKKGPKILLCLDEFASLGKMEILGALRKLRKKNVRIMVITQSLSDLELIYGHNETKSMMNNFSYQVILQANDTDTQKYFAELIGQVERERQSTTERGGGGLLSNPDVSITRSSSKEFIIEPSSLRRLGDNLIVLHPNGYDVLEKNFYFKD